MRYKVGDVVVTTPDCTPHRWRNKVAEITGISGDDQYWYCRIDSGTSNMGMYGDEILRLANDVEILEYKLTM